MISKDDFNAEEKANYFFHANSSRLYTGIIPFIYEFISTYAMIVDRLLNISQPQFSFLFFQMVPPPPPTLCNYWTDED